MVSKVVITKVSALTPLGNNVQTIANHLKNGDSGIKPITRFDTRSFGVRHAGEVDLSILANLSYPEEANLQFKMFYYSLVQLYQELKHSYASERIGCFIGTDPSIASTTNLRSMFERYLTKEQNSSVVTDLIKAVNPSLLLYYASRDFHIHGPAHCNLGTCSASTQAIGNAYKLIKHGELDMAIVGGVSSKIDPVSMSRLSRLDALEETKEDIRDNCRPFDKERRGFTMSEGCVLFVIESEEAAKKRNATILCEISGYGAALDGYSITDPHEDATGMMLSMQRAISNAGLCIDEIDYINAHGTGTIKNDKFETMAIKQVFGEQAYKLDISSTKSMHGHLMTTAGAMEVLVCILAIQHEFVPPTIHYSNADEHCDLNYTPRVSKSKRINHALTNSFGLGGQNASLIVSKY